MKNLDSNTGKTTSTSIYLNEKSSKKWDKVPRKSNFVSQLVNAYFNDDLVLLNLKSEIKEKFEEDVYKDALVNKLLEEYYKGNIMFVDDFIKTQRIIEQVNGSNNFSSIQRDQEVNSINAERELVEKDIESDTDNNVVNEFTSTKFISSDKEFIELNSKEDKEVEYKSSNETRENKEEIYENDEMAIDTNNTVDSNEISEINKDEKGTSIEEKENNQVTNVSKDNKEKEKEKPLSKKLQRSRRAAFAMNV